MHAYSAQHPIIIQNPLPSPDSINSNDSENEIVLELERRRRQIHDEISTFQAQKQEEFRSFERELRASRRRRTNGPSAQKVKAEDENEFEKPPSRTSSSSALDLLIGHGAPKPSQMNRVLKRKSAEKSFQCKTCSKTGPLPSKPVVSLDKMNIQGETIHNSSRPRTPPTPTLLSKTLKRSSPTLSLANSPPRSRARPLSLQDTAVLQQDDEKHDSLANPFTPSYLNLLETNVDTSYQSSSVLITPPVEDETSTAPCSFKSSMINEILPLSSSSFPPHVSFSPSSHTHASKRSYTAPTVPSGRKPSALRTASGGTISRKQKRVTFRLADSAIVQPSSSYEEGSSPDLEDDKGKQKRSGSGTRSPLGPGKSSLGSHLNSDEEDAEAGVMPGMGMGDVIKKLNEYTGSEAAKIGEDLQLEVDDDEEEEEEEEEAEAEEDDDEDSDNESSGQGIPMKSSGHCVDEQDYSDRDNVVKYHDHHDSPKSEDGYFSPKNKHISSVNPMPRVNSPIAPYRDDSWNQLSSSDKDRLLFKARRHSNEMEEQHASRKNTSLSRRMQKTGFTGGISHSVDGGSGVGFFELDEELASPDAGQVRPFEFDADLGTPEDTDAGDPDETVMKSFREMKADEDKRRANNGHAHKFGVGSLPIDIVRPSLSVNSSWVGTFGH